MNEKICYFHVYGKEIVFFAINIFNLQKITNFIVLLYCEQFFFSEHLINIISIIIVKPFLLVGNVFSTTIERVCAHINLFVCGLFTFAPSERN